MFWLVIMIFAIMLIVFTVVCSIALKNNDEDTKKMINDIAWGFLIGDIINKLNGKEDK